MFPDTTLALKTSSVLQRAGTGMCCQTLTAMTDPSFTEVTDCSLPHQNGLYAVCIRLNGYSSDSDKTDNYKHKCEKQYSYIVSNKRH